MGRHIALAQLLCLAAALAAASTRLCADEAVQARRALSPPRLDLRAPSLNRVLSPAQIRALSADLGDAPAEDVTIRATRETPACCGTFIAVPWALTHPRSAWRIFTPVLGPCPGTWCTEHPN